MFKIGSVMLSIHYRRIMSKSFLDASLGLLLLLLIPCLIFLALVACYELVTSLIGFQYRIGIQPLSVASLVVWNLIPNLVFYGALVACLSTLVRIRVLVAVIALGVLIGSVWVENQIPLRFQESLAQFLGSTLFPSDLAPVFVTSKVVVSKLAFLFISTALLLFAANLLPRTEPRRTVNTIIGVTVCSIAALMFFGLISAVHGTEDRKEEWVNAHRQQIPAAFPDIEHLHGIIDLRPGRNISLNVTLTVLTPSANTTDSVVFSLNPGYKIQKLFVDGEETTNFSFEAGLLKLSSTLFSEHSHTVQVLAKGKPDDRFAYLDQARDFQKLTHHSVPRLGVRNSIFQSDFVALMPGSVWYPISGTAVDRDKLTLHPRDVFRTDLTVSVPRRWHVAMVGKREVVENQKRNTFQFQSGAPLPELALIASRFEHRATTIEGVEFEVLFSKKHSQNLDVLAPINDQIVQWVSDRINTARALSLNYPYGAFYVVEVPSNLRIYGGGWRMDSVLQPPGMMLVRETTLPTANFESVLKSAYDRDSESRDEQHEGVFTILLEYFGNDEQGGNPFVGFARNFVSHQVSADQRGATALQYLLDQLSNQLVTQRESGSIVSESQFDTRPARILIGQTPDYHNSNNSAIQRRMDIASLPSTWDVMDQFALFDLDFTANPIPSYRVLLTKGHALAKSMITHYGAEKIGVFLEQLLTSYRGQTFNVEDLIAVASSVGIDFKKWVIPWLEETVLPGFLVTTPIVSKLENPELGKAEYQTTFILHNAEAMPGFVRVVWSEGVKKETMYRWAWGEFTFSEPIFLTGHRSKRIAIQSANPITGIWIEPFLSYNRVPLEVQVPEYNEETAKESSALPLVTDIAWQPPHTQAIVVDDLDPNFSIVIRTSDSGEYSTRQKDSQMTSTGREYDQGLMVVSFPGPGEWYRSYRSGSYGGYRTSHAKVAHGDQTSAARFAARLPHIGSWKLEIFVPSAAFDDENFWLASGNVFAINYDANIINRRADPSAPDEHYRLKIRDGNSVWTEEFDIANAKEGWNEVGQFELGSTEVEVLLSDWAGHKDIMVHADAIRWTPVNSE